MTKEQEIMNFLDTRVFEPVLNAKNISASIKSGVSLTKARMNRLSADKMVQFFWSALITDNGLAFSEKMKNESLPRFEDICEEFKQRFNDEWLMK